MARSSAAITQQEVDAFQQFARQHNIIDDESAEGQKNGELLGGVIVFKWQMDITPATLADAYGQIKDHLIHYTPAQQSWNAESRRLSQDDRDRILNYVRGSKNLKSDADSLFVNASALANWIVSHNYSLATSNLDVVLSQVAAQSRYPLVKQVHLQGSELEAQAAREAANNQQTPKHSDDDIPSYVPAHLREHYRSMHKPAKNVTPSTEASTMSHFEKLSRDAVASIASNNDRAEAERILTKVGGGWSWQMVYNSIRIFIDKRNQQRASVGR